MVTMAVMSKKKSNPGASKPNRKPYRMVRIPERYAAALERHAVDRESDLTEQVRIAVREYMDRLNLIPPNPTESTAG